MLAHNQHQNALIHCSQNHDIEWGRKPQMPQNMHERIYNMITTCVRALKMQPYESHQAYQPENLSCAVYICSSAETVSVMRCFCKALILFKYCCDAPKSLKFIVMRCFIIIKIW